MEAVTSFEVVGVMASKEGVLFEATDNVEAVNSVANNVVVVFAIEVVEAAGMVDVE